MRNGFYKGINMFILGVVFMTSIFFLCSCMNDDDSGQIYSLQEAYDNDFLTIEDLKSIAYYLSGGSDDESFVPINKEPAVLNDTTAENIKKAQAYKLRNLDKNPVKRAKPKDVTIVTYLGTYNGFVAVIIEDNYHDYPDVIREITVSDVVFHYNDGKDIVIWKQG